MLAIFWTSRVDAWSSRHPLNDSPQIKHRDLIKTMPSEGSSKKKSGKKDETKKGSKSEQSGSSKNSSKSSKKGKKSDYSHGGEVPAGPSPPDFFSFNDPGA
ncbi:hypothetical protein DL765_003894 [Monosporascus sp. GIB2]|nr:hypothetical protein DL765_003894 [Monosporascus sp. GIB2]